MKKFLKWTALVLLAVIVGAIAWFWTPDRSVEELREKYANDSSQFIELDNGLTVHVRDQGPRDAPVIMLLHGSSASLHTWEPWVESLSDEYRVISYDQPAHGLTGNHPESDYTADGFVETVEGVANALEIDRFVLSGNSMGGWVSWNYALAHPERLNGLILIDASGAPDSEPRSIPIGFRIASLPVIRELARKITPRSMIDTSLRQSVSNQAMVDDAMVDRYWELILYPGHRAATGERFRAERTVATPETMARLTMPTLIMWGDDDVLVPLSAGQWFAAHIPNSRLVRYAGVGHIPMEEAPEQSASDIRAFLAELYAEQDSTETAVAAQ